MTKLAFLLFIFGTTSIFAQNSACKKWKKGTFVVFHDEDKYTILVRKGGKQVEVSHTGATEEVRIRWINSCTYVIYRTEGTMRRSKKNREEVHPGIIITVEIIESYDNHCLVFVSSNRAGDVGYYDCLYTTSGAGLIKLP